MVEYGKWFVCFSTKNWYINFRVEQLPDGDKVAGLVFSNTEFIGDRTRELDLFLGRILINLTVGKHETDSSN